MEPGRNQEDDIGFLFDPGKDSPNVKSDLENRAPAKAFCEYFREEYPLEAKPNGTQCGYCGGHFCQPCVDPA